jgi:threonine synthase
MKYISTRGQAPLAGFEEVLLTGLARDGGLYVPETWPALTVDDIADLRKRPYAEVAARIIALFTGEAFSQAQLLDIAGAVYGRFDHADVAPLTKVGDEDWILELYHGPTLAFKDFAMQFLGRLFDDVLARRGERLTIIAATSGDTGAAAIDALKSCAHVDVVVLHPEGRVTDVQRRMMTCVDAANVQNIAVAGSFDDCQAIVKELFADRAFVSQVRLGGVNSINWARIAAQTVYYFTAAAAMTEAGEGVSFVVPTGNFGDIFAGYVAKKIGLNINRLVVATNANDILHRAMTSGDYAPAGVAPTLSPSMDIQVASNFERLLFEVMGRDADALRVKMGGFKRDGAMRLSTTEREAISADFLSYATSEDETIAELKRHFEAAGALIDPHTAVARAAAQALRQQGVLSGKVVTLSTAHPAKFPDAVMQATGTAPKLPPAHRDLFDRPEVMTNAANSTDAIKQAILAHVRQKA